jgi:hypothetical protein
VEFIAFFLVLGSILWLIQKKSRLTKPAREQRVEVRAWNEVRALRKDPSQMKSFDPDWVLRLLLKTHPEFIAQRDIKQVLADCVPHDELRVKQGRVVSCDWYWIVELLPGHSLEIEKRFVYILGWFDPQLREPVTHLKAWFFSSKEDAGSCAISGLENGIWKREPNQKLYAFLKAQIDKGEKVRRNPRNYWVTVSDSEEPAL